MDPTSEARRRSASVAMIVLLIVALATLVAGQGSGPGSSSGLTESSVERSSEHPTRALEMLRTAGFSALLLVVLAGFSSGAEAVLRGRPGWWRGRCRRAPPTLTTA